MKAGDNYMLIAKRNELYRLSGFGRGLAGWQYTVQPLDNTTGLGCTNPRALAFSKGYWYGVGESGPWRSDGATVESMVGPKRRSWRSVTSLDKCWVVNHPERQHILFGFVTNGQTTTQDLWCWDEQREVWSATWSLNPDIQLATYAQAIPTVNYSGPSVAPTDLTFTHASATLTSVTGVVGLGDVTASTEIWIDRGGGFTLDQTLVPAATGFTIAGLDPSMPYAVYARHIKGTIPSASGPGAIGYTRLEVPTLTATSISVTSATLHAAATGSTIQNRNLKRDGTLVKTWTNVSAGTLAYTDRTLACGTGYSYEAYHTNPDWPVAINTSDSVFLGLSTPACSGGL